MVGSLLLRGMLVGLVAGLLAFGFARIFGEPQVDKAIAFEEQSAAAEHQHEADAAAASGKTMAMPAEEVELVSRQTQAGLGLLTGIVVYGTALGGLFALVFAYANGRLGSLGPRGTAAVVALAGFIAVVIVPDIKYPANPPAVGNAETIGARTGLFLVMLLISVVAMVFAVRLARQLLARHGAWNASIVAGAALVVVLAVVMSILPAVNEVPANFSADVLWQFRVSSLGIHAILWTVIGLGFGAVAEQYLSARRPYAPVGKPLPS